MPIATANAYSPEWFEFFHVGIPASRTAHETALICQFCALPAFRRVLDVCCGMGRHARTLAARGYAVTGIERDPRAVAHAREQGGGPAYLQADIREYLPEPGSFDAAVVMSQSFGFFDPDTNRDVLSRLSRALRPRGRIILDLWNPVFFVTRQGRRAFELPTGTVQETTQLTDGRLFSRLDYPNGARDAFEWQTFSPAEMTQFVQPIGLTLVASCTDFDAAVLPSADKPRVQFLLERD